MKQGNTLTKTEISDIVMLFDSEEEICNAAEWINILKHYARPNSKAFCNFIDMSNLEGLDENQSDVIKGLYLNGTNGLSDAFHNLNRDLIPWLTLLVLENVTLNNDMLMEYTQFHSLELVYLNNCNMNDCDLSQMLVDCKNLKELHLIFSKEFCPILKLPQKLKILRISGVNHSDTTLDVSNCTELIDM